MKDKTTDFNWPKSYDISYEKDIFYFLMEIPINKIFHVHVC